MDIRTRALELQDELIALRNDFHRHPEESFKEFRTTDRVAEELDKLGIPYRRFEPTGLIGTITGGKPGKTVALRADMDALTVQETTGLPFASEIPGMMHACGHDTHTAMLLVAARILQEQKADLCGRVQLVFQPAEEVAGGAKCLVQQGAMDGVDAAFGLHIFAQLPPCSLGISKGALLPAADKFTITVKGLSCHGATPDRGADATVAASAITMNLQTIASREMEPLKPLVVTVGKQVSGTRWNIVSGEAYMEGTVRIFDQEFRKRMPEIIRRIASDTAAAFRCTAEVGYDFLVSPLQCDNETSEIAMAAARKVVGDELVRPFYMSMGSEDFAEYTVKTKSSFIALGGGGDAPQHSGDFVIEEKTLPVGAAMYAQAAVDYLNTAR